MKISINLASKPFVHLRPFLVTTGLLGGTGLLLTLLLLVVVVTTWRERTITRANLRALESQRGEQMAEQQKLESELRVSSTMQLLERARFFNQLIRRKSLSWAALFFDLQEQLPAQVRILSLSPTLREDGLVEVELRVGGASASSLIEFLRALEKGKKFRELVLHNQRRGGRGTPDAMVAQVSAIYAQEQTE